MPPTTTTTPSADPKISPKAKVTDSKSKAPGSPLARAPSPTARSIPASPVTEKKFDKESAEAVAVCWADLPPTELLLTPGVVGHI
jgi:hypothetical protein